MAHILPRRPNAGLPAAPAIPRRVAGAPTAFAAAAQTPAESAPAPIQPQRPGPLRRLGAVLRANPPLWRVGGLLVAIGLVYSSVVSFEAERVANQVPGEIRLSGERVEACRAASVQVLNRTLGCSVRGLREYRAGAAVARAPQ